MPVFVWEGRSRGGDTVSGEIDAESQSDAEQKLRAQQIAVSQVKQKSALDIKLKLPNFERVTTKDLVIFTRQFATMVDAGLPIVQALDLLGSQEPNQKFKSVILDVKHNVEGGSTLAESLARHPTVFDTLYVNLVAAGETGGVLDAIFSRLAIYIEKAAKLKSKIKGAMTYPLSVLVVAVLVILVMLWKVIPTFEEMFANFGNAALPAPTQIVINISHGVADYILYIFGAGFALVWIITYLMRNPKTRAVIDRIALKVPIIGPVIRKAAVARFTRTFGTMISSGVPILDALEIVARSSGNYEVEKAIMHARLKVSEGRTLVEPLMETQIFPDMVVQMIGVGEATGAMDTMLNKIADFYEEEVDEAVDGLTSLIEPIMMVGMGGIIAGLLLAMYLPIFSLADTVKNAH